MLQSVRHRLIFNSLLISLAAIIAVGGVTLVLVDAYFTQQERDYLEERANIIRPLLGQWRFNNEADLEQIVALTAFISDLRIQILDADQEVLVDSGPRTTIRLFDNGTGDTLGFGLSLDQGGPILAMPENGFTILPDGGLVFPASPSPSLEIAATSLIMDISDTDLLMPLNVRNNETVGYLRFSEGPAAGSGIKRSIQLALMGGSVAAIFVAIVVGGLSGRQVTRPLAALGRAAEQMADEQLEARVPANHLHEFDHLAGQFNSMADQLAATIGRLQQERVILRRMIADASHELRTPLTALKTFNTLLQDESDPALAQTFVGEMDKQIDQLDRLTSGLLDLSRLEARLSGTNFVQSDLRSTLSKPVQRLQPLADAKQHTITVSLPNEPVELTHDATALEQAVGNLLGNAIKYTAAGGQIRVALAIDKGAAIITVSDNGPGISAEALPHIFDRFYRDPATNTDDGSGLGLAIAREIVIIHGGNITVDSSPNGSTFAIRLPKN